MPKTIPIITVPLTVIPRAGGKQMISRVSLEDYSTINAAASAIGMNQAEFQRTVLVNAAHAVLTEAKAA